MVLIPPTLSAKGASKHRSKIEATALRMVLQAIHGVFVRVKGPIRIKQNMNWRFSSTDISCCESNFRPPAVLMSAVLILGSTFSGLLFTRWSVI